MWGRLHATVHHDYSHPQTTKWRNGPSTAATVVCGHFTDDVMVVMKLQYNYNMAIDIIW